MGNDQSPRPSRAHDADRFSDIIGLYDHVTRLPNRTQFLARLADEGETARQASTACTVVLVTLAEAQHFNHILRALGHDFSEDFIRAGATRIAQALPAGVDLYNVSVLSFAFVVGAHAEPGPQVLAERLGAQFEEPVAVANIPIRSKAGVGLVDFDPAVSAPAETVRAALTAAQDSRNRHTAYAHYDAQSDSAQRRAFQILTDLPGALESDGQLDLYYQPRIDLQSGSAVAAEALLRWCHPTLGWISPGEFMPLVESTALITPLTMRVMETAVQQLSAWSQTRPALRVSVNVSPRNLGEPDFLQRLERLLERHDVAPHRLELEFTESAISPDDARTLGHLRAARAMGITVAIDDFGSGYSNMAYLTKIPADFVKIDKGLIQHLEPDGRSGFLAHRVTDLARGLGFRVVGEGVESAEVYRFLAEIGCSEAQGFYMSRPRPVTGFLDWLDAS